MPRTVHTATIDRLPVRPHPRLVADTPATEDGPRLIGEKGLPEALATIPGYAAVILPADRATIRNGERSTAWTPTVQAVHGGYQIGRRRWTAIADGWDYEFEPIDSTVIATRAQAEREIARLTKEGAL